MNKTKPDKIDTVIYNTPFQISGFLIVMMKKTHCLVHRVDLLPTRLRK